MPRAAFVAVLVLALASPAPADEAAIAHAGSRWRLTATVRTGSMPWGASVAPDGTSIYVTHVGYKDHDNVYRYDVASLRIAARAQFAGHAVESVPSRDGRTLLVTNSRRHELLVLDAVSLEVRARHATGKIPKDLRLSPDGKTAYVADYGGDTLSMIDLESGKRRAVPVGKRPRGVAVTPDGARIYVLNQGSNTVTVVDAATLAILDTWRACAAPRHAVVVSDLLLVTCYGARHLSVLNSASGKLLRRVEVGRGPKTVAVTHDGRVAITADERGDSITLVDLRSFATRTLALRARKPCGVAIAPDDRRIYVTARGSDELLVFERVSD